MPPTLWPHAHYYRDSSPVVILQSFRIQSFYPPKQSIFTTHACQDSFVIPINTLKLGPTINTPTEAVVDVLVEELGPLTFAMV